MSIEAAQAYICSHQNIAAANVDAVVDVVCSTRAGSQQNCYEQGGAGDLGFTSSELRQTLLQVRGDQTDGAALQNNVRRFCLPLSGHGEITGTLRVGGIVFFTGVIIVGALTAPAWMPYVFGGFFLKAGAVSEVPSA